MMPFLRVLLFCFLYFRVYFVRNGKLLSTHGTNTLTAVTIVVFRADIARTEVEVVRAEADTRTERTRPVPAVAARTVETAVVAEASSRQENINTGVVLIRNLSTIYAIKGCPCCGCVIAV